MIRGLTITTALLLATVEPVTSDTDLVRYGITQGGLLAVVLVLLWYIRELHKRPFETLSVLTDLVAQTNQTMQKSINVSEAQERAIQQLSRTLEERSHRRKE